MLKNKPALLLIFAIALFSCRKNNSPSDAQSDKFVKIFGNYGVDAGSEVLQTSDDGYIFVGTIETVSRGKDITVIKTDKFGNEEWSKTYGDTLDNFGNSIKIDGSGYVILGTTTDTTDATDMYLLKINSSGNETFSKKIGTIANESGAEIQVTSDNGYILIGTTSSERKINNVGGQDSVINPAGAKDIYLVKLASSGDIEWTERYGANQEEIGNSVIQISSGGYVLLGSTTSFTETGYTQSSIFMIEVNQNGDISGGWNLFGGTKNDYAGSVRQVSDGYIILGTTASFSSSGTDIYLAKVSTNLATITWESALGSASNEVGNALYVLSDESIAIGGYTDNLTSNGGRDQYIIKVSSSGEEEWSSSFGGTGNDEIHGVQQTSDDGFILVGTTDFEGNQMISLSKTDAEGNIGKDQTE